CPRPGREPRAGAPTFPSTRDCSSSSRSTALLHDDGSSLTSFPSLLFAKPTCVLLHALALVSPFHRTADQPRDHDPRGLLTRPTSRTQPTMSLAATLLLLALASCLLFPKPLLRLAGLTVGGELRYPSAGR